MPTAERLAANGLKYNRVPHHRHVLAHPPGAADRRNHHSAGMGCITELATSAARLLIDAAQHRRTIGRDAELNGYSTASSASATRCRCGRQPDGTVRPLAQPGGGFEYFYASSAGRPTSTTPASTKAPTGRAGEDA